MTPAVRTINPVQRDKQVVSVLVTASLALQLLTECCTFSTPHQRFTFVHLLYSYLTRSWQGLFRNAQHHDVALTAPSGSLLIDLLFYLGIRDSLRLIEASSCKTTPVGRFHHLCYSMQRVLCRLCFLAHLRNVGLSKLLLVRP